MRIAFGISILLAALCLAPVPFSRAADDPGKAGGEASPKRAIVSGAVTPDPVEGAALTNAASAANEPSPQAPESPEGLHVKFRDDRLSVNVKDQNFGDVIAVIANLAAFDVELSNDVYDMKLSTMFEDARLQRGILRLISLINQKNYFIHYKPDGSIKRLEVYGDLSSGQRAISGQRPTSGQRPPTKRATETTPAKRRPPTPPTMVVPERTPRQRIPVPSSSEISNDITGEPVEEEEVLELYFRHFTPETTDGGNEEARAGGAEPASAPAPAPSPSPTPTPAPAACPPGMILAPVITCPQPPCVPETEPTSGTCILDAPYIGP